MVWPHQAVFDADLPRDEVDQATVNEVRRNAFWPLFSEHQRFAFDAWQTADARSDRAARAKPFGFGHFGQARILKRLTRRINAVDDEGINLPLNLVINALVGIKTVRMIGRFHFACNRAELVRRIEPRDPRRARFRCEQICPGRFNVSAQRRDKAQSGYDNTTHGEHLS